MAAKLAMPSAEPEVKMPETPRFWAARDKGRRSARVHRRRRSSVSIACGPPWRQRRLSPMLSLVDILCSTMRREFLTGGRGQSRHG